MNRILLNLLGLTAAVAAAIAFYPVSATAATRTWDGGGANSLWTNATNWVDDVAPVAGDDLFFPVAPPNLFPVNNFPAGTTFNSLIFAGGGYTLGGSSIALNAGILATNGANNFINNPLVLNSNQTFTIKAGSSSFSLPTAIDTNGKDLTWDIGTTTLAQVQAVISGAGGLIKTGAGSVLLYASNTFSGPVQINQGFLNIYHGHSLGDTNAATTVASGTILTLANSITVAEPLVLSGTLNIAGPGQVLAGPLTLATTNPTIQVATDASLAVDAVISGPGGFTKAFPGTLTLNSNNTFPGTIFVTAGTLAVNGSQPNNPVNLAPGTLAGTGTVGAVTFGVVGSRTLTPGNNGPSILTCSNLSLYLTTLFATDLNGAIPGFGYDQVNVHGTVALSNAILSLTLGYTPALGDTFTIINNDGADPVSGTFNGLLAGALLTNGATIFRIAYNGGDGNDVILTTTLGAPASTLTSITNLPSSFKQLTGQGVSNLTYAVQAATNLAAPITWTPLGAATANSNGVYQFTDTNAPLFPLRFYRAVSP
jgi:autotransporter-associated beta strand protein